MYAIKDKLTEEETSMMHVLNWMEQSYKDKCWVLDVDFKQGSVALYGPETQKFRKEFNNIIDFIEAGVSLDGQILRMKVADVDRRREQDLRTHHPELADAIAYEGPQ